MQLMQLGAFFAAVIALVVCGCIFTRKPPKSQQSTPEPGKTEIGEPPLGA